MTKKFLILFAVLLLFVTAIPAFATTVSYTTSTPIPLTTLTNWTSTLAFQQFNPLLGTLNSVKLDLSGSMSTVITVTSSSNATGWAKTSVDLNVQDAGSNLNSPPISLMSPSFVFTDLIGTVVSPALNKSDSSSDTYTVAAVLSEFTGTSNYLLPANTFTETLVSFTSGNATTSQVTYASLTGTVTYDYTVPEPATIGLLTMGGLALIRRKTAK
jgi:hypothetical protein